MPTLEFQDGCLPDNFKMADQPHLVLLPYVQLIGLDFLVYALTKPSHTSISELLGSAWKYLSQKKNLSIYFEHTYGLIKFFYDIPRWSYPPGITLITGVSIDPQIKSAHIGYQDQAFKIEILHKNVFSRDIFSCTLIMIKRRKITPLISGSFCIVYLEAKNRFASVEVNNLHPPSPLVQLFGVLSLVPNS